MDIARSRVSHDSGNSVGKLDNEKLRIWSLPSASPMEMSLEAVDHSNLTTKMVYQKTREPRVGPAVHNGSNKYSERKKRNSQRCATLAYSSHRSNIIEETMNKLLDVTPNEILGNESAKDSTKKLNICNFPYYRSWRNTHYEDVVLVKDACVSCTILTSDNPIIAEDTSKGSSLESKFVKQLKQEYSDLSAITKKISSYTRDILTSIATRTGKKYSTGANISEDHDVTVQPVAMQYFDKSGLPCLKLRFKKSSARNCESIPSNPTNEDRQSNLYIREILSSPYRSMNENSSNYSAYSICDYVMCPGGVFDTTKKMPSTKT